ncbi:hypothetical protein JGY90_05375 [Staphylococcus xylosus]|uniref:hypothetical protein n=1 Tax=Staphylococcus xylosus TaxID=1288 RepID=UPI001CDD7FBC|nr:hypothetical protein [Staphylococcus xylosus]UBV35686.1 hypothetical protein JGY90_05375 [Staphylococcus xylosus]
MENVNSNEIANIYLNSFLEGYKYVVNNRFIYQYESNPEAFPFMEKDNYTLSVILLNDSFFEYPKVIVISNKANANFEYNHRNEDKYRLSQNFIDYTKRSEKYVLDHLNIIDQSNNLYYIDLFHSEYPFDEVKDFLIDEFETKGRRRAEKDYKNFTNSSQTMMKNKTHKEVSPFNHLDLESMKTLVKDETFSYQINQGLEAYKRELYLPAAATFAVAIETFLIKLKKANNIKHKDSDSTMYNQLLEDLKQKGKVNYRTKRRVEVAYSMRNIINHSQIGAVAKADCDFLLNTLKDIVESNQKILFTYNESVDESE